MNLTSKQPGHLPWYNQPCVGGAPTVIDCSGDKNNVYFTSNLTQSMIYSVKTQNGECPEDFTDFTVEVKKPLSIISITTVTAPCLEEFVNLKLDFEPCTIEGCNTACLCSHTVEWYLNDHIIGVTSVPSGLTQAVFPYSTLPLSGYFVKVQSADRLFAVAKLVKE